MKTKAFSRLLSALSGCAAASALVLSPWLSHPAEACGGFWCSRAAPVNQAAEQIIFVDNPDSTVTAVIQISYAGPSTKFAWLIPIPGKPDIAVSSNTAFDRLEQATAPSYMLEQHIEGMCKPGGYPYGGEFGTAAPSAATNAGAAQDKAAVMVIEQGSVGPYDYTVIALDPSLSKPADAAIQWLMGNGYDLTGVDGDLLGPYLADGLNLLAFKLTKGSETGSIRPVVLTYESKLPSIPIRPTAVAAQDNMGIRVWVASVYQAVPENYKSLVINEALINWFYYQSNYNDVVTAAADEAGGQGFVTELAGPADPYKDTVYADMDQKNLESVMSQSFSDGIDAIFAANQYFRGWDGWRDSIADATTLPAGVSLDDFGRNPDAYRGMAKVDTQKFFADLKDKVLKPLQDTQKLINSRPYLTRMYSTMSSDEMTVDPAFTYNADLANVSNKHVAQEYIECTPSVYQYEAPYRIELPQGGVIRGQGGGNFGGGPWPVAAGSQPANLKIVQLSMSGQGKVVEDNSGAIGGMLYKASGTMGTGSAIPAMPTKGVMIGGAHVVKVNGVAASPGMNPSTMPRLAPDSGASGCSVGALGSARSAGGALGFVLALLGVLVARRPRRVRG